MINRTLLLILMVWCGVFAYKNMKIGDSISKLLREDIIDSCRGVSETWIDKGVSGYSANNVYDSIDVFIAAAGTDLKMAWLQCGTNDLITNYSLDATLDYIEKIYKKVKLVGADLVVGEIPPGSYAQPMDIMHRNWRLKKWCIKNHVKMAETYFALVDTTKENSLPVYYGSDGVHPNTTVGRAKYSRCFGAAIVPSNINTYKIKDTTLTLFVGYGNKTVTITGGTSVRYRASNSWFTTKNATISYTNYTAPFSLDRTFLQVDLTDSAIVSISSSDNVFTISIGNDSGKYVNRTKDCYIISSQPTRSYASSAFMWLGPHTSFVELIRFDLGSVVDWTKYDIISAKLVQKVQTITPTHDSLYVNRLNKAWGVTSLSEGALQNPATSGQVTWSNALRYGTGSDVAWGNGTNFTLASDCEAGTLDTTFVDSGLAVSTSIDVDVTKGFIKDTANSTNYGYTLYTKTSSILALYPKEGANGVRPSLDITLRYREKKSTGNNKQRVSLDIGP